MKKKIQHLALQRSTAAAVTIILSRRESSVRVTTDCLNIQTVCIDHRTCVKRRLTFYQRSDVNGLPLLRLWPSRIKTYHKKKKNTCQTSTLSRINNR